MELRTLHYFTVVARELNITRAAEKLNMSQPPLSNQIKALEEELGVQLFIRGKRHLELTEEGALLLRRAVQMQELADKTRQEIASLREGMTGTIYLSMVEGRAPFLAAQWIAGFQEEFPLVRYNLWNGSSDDVLDRLHKGLADLAVIAAPYDTEHLEGFSVGQEPWAAMLHPDHPLAKEPGEAIPLSCLVGEPLIVPSRKSRIESIRRWFGDIRAEPRILCEMSNYMDAVALTSQGVGVSIFPQTVGVSNGLVVSKVVTQPARQAEYILVWNKGQAPSGLTREFIRYVQDYLEERQSKA
ncbi:LysR family transcriptional regulator [Flintibacter muris]|uniref:LysR family transcriptional regulator n=1 Tax=Flintibacter muris TaxID=2941327 RepID=UPI0020409C4E|nr:LysR family transcriptional regulator [Flintibacter muris]